VNALDVVAILLLVIAVVAGIRSGALPQIGGITGALAGLVAFLLAGPWIVDLVRPLDPLPRALVVLAGVLLAVGLGEALGSAAGQAIATTIGTGRGAQLDRAAGGAVGAVQAVLVVWLVGGLLAAGPFPSLAALANGSAAVRSISRILPSPAEFAGEVAQALDASGLPEVFVGLEPVPAQPVERPDDATTRVIAAVAEVSVAKVASIACTSALSGSGFVVAPGYVVTNAHVVAGAHGIRVTAAGQTVDATVVHFDPTFDIAVLHVPRLTAPPLRLAARNPVRGDVGALLGYPGGGQLVIVPAGVTGDYPATGRDIYGTARVTRDILELRAEVERGDSGGPLVLVNGTVGGIVFAESRTDPEVGYALSPTAVAAQISPAIGRTSPVDTGACIR
jgi:S1-C subfamily serine protease